MSFPLSHDSHDSHHFTSRHFISVYLLDEPFALMSEGVAVVLPDRILEKINSVKDLEAALPDILNDLQGKRLPEHAVPVLERSVRNQLQLLGEDAPRVCFLGKTGSGKTSLINAVLGVELLPGNQFRKSRELTCVPPLLMSPAM